MTSPRRGAAAVVAAGILFGTTGTAQTFAPAGAEPLSVGAARLFLGGLLLGLIGLARWAGARRASSVAPPGTVPAASPTDPDTQPSDPHNPPSADPALPPAPADPTWVADRLPRWLPVALWVALGAGCVLAYQATFFAGTRANGVAVGTVVALGSSPLFAGLFEWLAFRRRPTLRWLGATGLAVLGVVLLARLIGATDARADAGGLLASLAAGASYAGYTIATKALLLRGWGSVSAVSVVMAAGAALALPVLLAGDTGWLAQPAGIAVVAWLGVVTVVVTYLLIGLGLVGLRAATVATLTLAEPATATLLGVLVLHEPLGLVQLLGILAVAAGVLVAGLGGSHRLRTASP